MLYLSKKLLLLALVPLAAVEGKPSEVTKTFKFKDDIHLRFHPLFNAIGPDNVDTLMAALDGFAQKFKEVWIEEIESNLQNGACKVNAMRLPEFSMCDWRYPDLYDVDELPTPGQCYDYESGFVQRIYYKVKKLEITCPDDFDYDDLDKDEYTKAAISEGSFVDYINPPDVGCDGDATVCLFETAETVETSSFEVCNAELFINRFVDIPVYLKCLDYIDGYGTKTANKLIKALDKWFELKIAPVIAGRIYEEAPEGHIYNFASPYASDRKYCGHGSYYAGGSLVDQVTDDEGFIITKFTYGFDLIWYKPKDFDGVLLEDDDLPAIITSIFEDRDFLSFLKEEYPNYDFVQDADVCDVVDPGEEGVTFPPTEEPTPFPTRTPSDSPNVPIIITSEPTMAPSTKTPSFSPTLRPTTLSPTISNAPSDFIEPSLSPSHSSMPSSEPTPIPSSAPPTTLSPTGIPTGGSTETENTQKTTSPTSLAPVTPSPTCPQCIIHPDDLEEDECPIATTGTCADGDRGDGICPYAGYCCSKWGYCGTTPEYCEDDSVAPTPSTVVGAPVAPTYSVDAGQCANGDEGDGFCTDKSFCCSDWGYCGAGEQYCFSTRIIYEDGESNGDDGTCGGGSPGDGTCRDGNCCSEFGFCGTGELYCTGVNELEESDASESATDQVLNSSPLPDYLLPDFGFRCGITEVDARSNCKPECTHLIQCEAGEECWGVQLNYCETFVEGEHPICENLDKADNDSRCGYDEVSARGHCGPKCTSDDECGENEFCFPTLLNLCECHEESCPEESAIAFANAKALISPYFVVAEDPNNSKEGVPLSSSHKLTLGSSASLLAFSLMSSVMWLLAV